MIKNYKCTEYAALWCKHLCSKRPGVILNSVLIWSLWKYSLWKCGKSFILKESLNSGALHSCKKCIQMLIQLWIKLWDCLLLDKFIWRGVFFWLFRIPDNSWVQNLKLQHWLALSNDIWLEVMSAQSWLELLITHIYGGWNCQLICSLLEIILSFCFHPYVFYSYTYQKNNRLKQQYEWAIKDLSKWITLKSRVIYDHFLWHCLRGLLKLHRNSIFLGEIWYLKIFLKDATRRQEDPC